MALAFSSCFLQSFSLFLCFSGVNHLVHPMSGGSVGSGMEPDYSEPLPMEDRNLYMMSRRLSVPPSHVDPIDEPIRRHYKLEDFLWAGSGDGPNPSEQDGGLAWEDNGGGVGRDDISRDKNSRSWIKVTKTMTLYRTVLTTIYPVEMTPTVISGVVAQPTPHLSSSLFHDSWSASSSVAGSSVGMVSDTWLVTPTFLPSPEPTSTLPTPPSAPGNSTGGGGDHDNFSAESTDIVYWIQTSIKANDSAFRDAPKVFQMTMQKNLASVYASAFKRHLLSTLGVLAGSTNNRRRRRQAKNEPQHDDLHWLQISQSTMSSNRLKHLTTAAMNVTVSILNVTSEPRVPRVDVNYVVLAEGTPVPASSAVRELDLVSKEEMEHQIGFEIINKKAEALVAGPPEQMTRNEQMVSTSPWLIVAMTTIGLLVILLALIGFMVWKWKHNRLGDSRRPPASISARPQSGIEIEEGVINPAFLGTPSHIGRGGIPEQSPKSSPVSSLLESARRAKRISSIITKPCLGSDKDSEKKRRHKFEPGHSPTSSDDLKVHKRVVTSSEGSSEWKELLGESKQKQTRAPLKSSLSAIARVRQRSPVRSKSSNALKQDRRDKDVLRRRRRKSQISKIEEATLKTDESEMSQSSGEEEEKWEGQDSDMKSVQETGPHPSRGVTDAISLGNLDICQDAIAQIPSEYAKKMVPWKRPSSAISSGGVKTKVMASAGESSSSRRPGSRVALPETIEEIPSFDLTEDEDGAMGKEQDRDLSERSFDLKDSPRKSATSPTPDTKDAQVQTPTRISKTASHKARAAPKPRRSWKGSPGGPSESVISTESEEIVEVHHINSSMSDDQNPLGRMRKRFHQFLDDAFNVMGGRREEGEHHRSETQSAKVSICHEVVEAESEWRPWTSHVIREETLQKLKRPKSAAVPIGPPKRAWTASSERRSHSAKSSGPDKSGRSTGRLKSGMDNPETRSARTSRPQTTDIEEDDEYDKSSMVSISGNAGGIKIPQISPSSNNATDLSQSHSVVISPAFIFPQYPTYPDIRIDVDGGGSAPNSTSGSTQSHILPAASLPPNDPAVPLIQAIKNEMKRFEKEPKSK